MDELPVVLLGFPTTWKEDLDATPALLTYGTKNNLRVPGDFLPPLSVDKLIPTSPFVQELQENLQKLALPPPAHHGSPTPYVPCNLQFAEQVYVRIDSHRGPLVRPYNGPFRVLARSDKYFDTMKNGKSARISVDRLKPANLCSEVLSSTPVASGTPPKSYSPQLTDNHTIPRSKCEALVKPAGAKDTANVLARVQQKYPLLSDTSTPRVTKRFGRLVQKPTRYRTIYRLSRF